MRRLIAWIQAFAIGIGGPGLFLIGFLDSSVLSLPEINDILVVSMVMQHPERLVYYAAMSTLGSIAGCFLLYWLGYKGGEAFLRKRFNPRRVERGLALFRQYGVVAIFVPAILPPPAPFKIFVLLAGVSRVNPWTFAGAIAAGRGVRYFGEGLLAIWYGEQTIAFLEQHGLTIAIVIAAIGALAGAWWVRRRRSPPTALDRHPVTERPESR
jgi:membrane protein YqaA with SNARE-associated domain